MLCIGTGLFRFATLQCTSVEMYPAGPDVLLCCAVRRVAQKHAEWQGSGVDRGKSCLDFLQQMGYREYSRWDTTAAANINLLSCLCAVASLARCDSATLLYMPPTFLTWLLTLIFTGWWNACATTADCSSAPHPHMHTCLAFHRRHRSAGTESSLLVL
jgi:hypothetical protein